MPAISAAAPGKAILFGEHAVVYSRPAIAVPVTQVQAKAVITPFIPAPSGKIHIEAPAVGLSADLADLPARHPIKAAVDAVLGELGIAQVPAMSIRISSTIPVAGGMGSGAAVSVALIRAISTYLGMPLADEKVSSLAFEVEKIHHGNPSGIDNSVITFRQPIYYVRGQPIRHVVLKAPITLVIGDTGISSPTANAVADVRAGWERDPEFYETRFDAIGSITGDALNQMEGGTPEELGPLMNENHALLKEIGVSCPELDRLVEAARASGAWGAKLSGGGRGGNMIAVASPESASGIAAALEKAGAVHTITSRVDP